MQEALSGAAPRRVFMSVAETSGDQHAAALIRSLRQLEPGIIVEGIGGPLMRQAGAVIHHETVGRAAMLYHALARVAEFWRILRWTRAHYDAHKPDLHICIDSSGMNFHFARLAHERGVKVLYYIAPQLWASRPGRMKKLRKWVDRVACIQPFEQDYFRSHGVDATFVGHPLFDELPAQRPSMSRPPAAQELAARAPVIGLLAGSRRTEVRANFPHLLEVARRIRAAFPGTVFLAPTTAATHELTAAMLGQQRDLPGVQLQRDGMDQMVPHCDLCIAKSGTTTLHVAAYGVPMIVVYRLHPLAWYLIGQFLLKSKSVALVNLLAGPEVTDRIVPEIIPWFGPIQPVAELAIEMLRQPELLDAQREKLLRIVRTLDKPGASLNTAKLALEMIGRPTKPEIQSTG